jgi:plastocyanin
MSHLRASIAVAALALALIAASAQATTSAKLVGTVGPGFTITLTKGGTKVAKLKPGTYKITVRDRAATHDFHLVGPGVNKTTGVSFTGSVVWTVKLKKGTYKYQCDPHASFMKGSFKVS